MIVPGRRLDTVRGRRSSPLRATLTARSRSKPWDVGPSRPRAAGPKHYPELGTEPISFDDSTSPEFYALEREAIFKRAWLNVGRVEDLPRTGSYFTKELEAAGTSIIVVRGHGGQVRAFHNICRHRGNKLVWGDYPRAETRGTCRQFTCKYHGWRYDLDGALAFVQQESEFFDLDKSDYGLVPVHCDIWAGFVFVNVDAEPRQSLREFLGPMITALEGYPFDAMTERYEFRADNESNWKLFADAFQEYYHVPILHPQQVPAALRNPDVAVEGAHYQLDGPHRMTSTAGARRWTMPEIRCTRSSAPPAAACSARGRARSGETARRRESGQARAVGDRATSRSSRTSRS